MCSGELRPGTINCFSSACNCVCICGISFNQRLSRSVMVKQFKWLKDRVKLPVRQEIHHTATLGGGGHVCVQSLNQYLESGAAQADTRARRHRNVADASQISSCCSSKASHADPNTTSKVRLSATGGLRRCSSLPSHSSTCTLSGTDAHHRNTEQEVADGSFSLSRNNRTKRPNLRLQGGGATPAAPGNDALKVTASKIMFEVKKAFSVFG